MKAIDIINFINEDKFSKYTVKQVYDELGEEEFFNYIDSIVRKVIKNIRDLTNSKLTFEVVDNAPVMLYTQKATSKIIKHLAIKFFFSGDFIKLYAVHSKVGGTSKDRDTDAAATVEFKDINITKLLTDAIVTLCREATFK